MSWSCSYTGRPELIVARLKADSEKKSGQCKAEYDAALPHLIGIVEQNFSKPGEGHGEVLIEVEASGSGSTRAGVEVSRCCSVKIKQIYGALL